MITCEESGSVGDSRLRDEEVEDWAFVCPACGRDGREG